MSQIVHTETILSDPFDLAYNENNEPLVVYKNKTYRDLNQLIHDAPALLLESEIGHAVRIVNFLLYGLRYEVIENTNSFKEVKKESSLQNLHQGPYGIYDLGEIRSPIRNGNQWIFYVLDKELGIPYKVSFKFPAKGKPFECKYSLLPFNKI